MKHEKWVTFLIGTVLTFMLSFSCAGCIAGAFELGRYADLTQVALWCAIISVICNFLPTVRVGWLTPILLAAFAILSWKYGDLERSLKALLHSISVYCDEGYGCGILEWKDLNPKQIDRTLALQAIASMVAMFTGWCVCDKRSCGWAILAAVVALAPCTLVIFTVPDVEYLFLWLLSLIILILTQGIRRQNEHEGNRLTLWLFVPCIIAMALLFRFLPQNEYNGRERAEQLLSMVEPYIGFDHSQKSATKFESVVDLENESAPNRANSKVMEVSADATGTYYLRGRAYDIYTGLSWENSNEQTELPWQPCGPLLANVEIETIQIEPIIYLPYYSEAMSSQQVFSYLDNEDNVKHYSYHCYESAKFSVPQQVSKQEIQALTQLPPQTRQWAIAFLEETFSDREIFANAIAEYVRSYADYDLSTPKMSEDYTDFAQWFLMESDTGYCVHFATATTVLLRAAGIPARYVTGYAIEMTAGKEVKVYQNEAHAWVEYWTPNDGWQILDPTPSAEQGLLPEVTESDSEESMQEELTESSESSEEESEETVENTSASETEPLETEPSETVESAQDEKETTAPQEITQNKEETSTYNAAVLLIIIKWIAIALAIIATVILQWRLRVQKRERKLRHRNSNVRALEYWALISTYSEVLRQKPDASLYKLVSKAKFSQHEISDEELAYLERNRQQYIQKLRMRAWYQRLYDRSILALY